MHNSPAGAQRDHAGQQRQCQQDLVLRAQPELEARQNVWVEVGRFWGRLGRDRVLLLVRGNLEIPSDLDGIEYHSYKQSVLELEPKIQSFLLQLGKRNQ